MHSRIGSFFNELVATLNKSSLVKHSIKSHSSNQTTMGKIKSDVNTC
jgi:hypothetical protein